MFRKFFCFARRSEAEAGGFEPPSAKGGNGFRDRRIKPLCHASTKVKNEILNMCP